MCQHAFLCHHQVLLQLTLLRLSQQVLRHSSIFLRQNLCMYSCKILNPIRVPDSQMIKAHNLSLKSNSNYFLQMEAQNPSLKSLKMEMRMTIKMIHKSLN